MRSYKLQGNDPEPLRTNVDHSKDVMILLTDFYKKMELPELHARKLIVVQIPVHPLLLKQQRKDEPICGMRTNTHSKTRYHKTISLVLRQVSFKYDTTSGHTPTMFATTSTRPSMERSFVIMALRNAGRDAIQSRVSAPFRRFTTNSVMENGSRLPNTDAAVRWRQRFNSRKSNVGHSTSFAGYPLPRWLPKALARTCGPPCRDTTDVPRPAASTIFAMIVASRVVLALNRLNTATQTR